MSHELNANETVGNPLEITLAVDVFMLYLILVDDEKATTLRLPIQLQRVYKDVCGLVGANPDFVFDEKNEDSFLLIFKSTEEQDKVWAYLYEFSHSGQRTYSAPNVYDQSTGELVISDLNEFVESAIRELKEPTDQYMYLFDSSDLAHAKLNGKLLNEKFKSTLGNGVRYMMAWDFESSAPLLVMAEGIKNPVQVRDEFYKSIVEMIKRNSDDSESLSDVILHIFNPTSIEIASRFGCEDLEFWNEMSAKMAVIGSSSTMKGSLNR